MTAAVDQRAGFVRAVEAEYARRVTAYQGAGLSPEGAHLRALDESKQFGREALEELRRRGLFPWLSAELEQGDGADVR